MNEYPEKVKERLNSILRDMSENSWLFVTNPGHDFTRQDVGKLSFEDTIRIILSMGKGTVSDELIDFFHMDADLIPTQSALIQRRHQLAPNAFEYLFNEFSSSFPETTHQFKGKSILAADGTHVVYSTNAQILEDYNKPRLTDHKGFNHMHLNGFVDVMSKVFLNVVIQPGQHPDERQALHTMLDRFDPDDPGKYIITADRGYESYDLVFHCECKKLFYVFRAKSPNSPRSLLSTFKNDLPDDKEEFDVTVKRFVTDKKTNIIKEQPDVYLYMNPNKNIPHFPDFLITNHLGYLSFRVLKIKTSETTHEYIITNLPETFDINDVKECYHWRWGIEIAFRYLKHAAGLLYFHSKIPEFVKQEIYASLILYNFGILLANEANAEKQRRDRQKTNKHLYHVDFSTALRTAAKYFRRRPDDKNVDIIKLLCKFVHAVKDEFRQFDRPLHGIGAVHFSYR